MRSFRLLASLASPRSVKGCSGDWEWCIGVLVVVKNPQGATRGRVISKCVGGGAGGRVSKAI